MGHALARNGALFGNVRSFRQLSQTRHRIRVVYRLGERVAAVKTEPALEAFLDLECPSMMDGICNVIVGEEITELRESPSAGSAVENGLARGQRPRLHSVQDAADGSDLERVDE